MWAYRVPDKTAHWVVLHLDRKWCPVTSWPLNLSLYVASIPIHSSDTDKNWAQHFPCSISVVLNLTLMCRSNCTLNSTYLRYLQGLNWPLFTAHTQWSSGLNFCSRMKSGGFESHPSSVWIFSAEFRNSSVYSGLSPIGDWVIQIVFFIPDAFDYIFDRMRALSTGEFFLHHTYSFIMFELPVCCFLASSMTKYRKY